ncbi:hypothetical protein [Streptomyces sp. G-G2]|uniref:hypothetical protein n=1 Tax=Streptomyces sp. G-G2 TaxID=3046201 RepID=UPI0024B950FB|nr:hypothetical protein [Streptomyces sp. G-G2]MDJ0384208.1 hypothetical protein [Streptomyces sp. G-G2]
MRTHRTFAALGAVAFLSLTGCQTVAPTGTTPATPRPTTPKTRTATVPNLVGKGLQSAQDESQAAGFPALTSHDALGRGRVQAVDRHWKVCTQAPAAGQTVPAETTLDFGAVKLEETCPTKDQGPEPQAAGVMPDFTGKSVKAVRGSLPSNTSMTVKDATQGRMVLQDSNWKVCAQTPKPGTALTGQPLAFTAVKFEEPCP